MTWSILSCPCTTQPLFQEDKECARGKSFKSKYGAMKKSKVIVGVTVDEENVSKLRLIPSVVYILFGLFDLSMYVPLFPLAVPFGFSGRSHLLRLQDSIGTNGHYKQGRLLWRCQLNKQKGFYFTYWLLLGIKCTINHNLEYIPNLLKSELWKWWNLSCGNDAYERSVIFLKLSVIVLEMNNFNLLHEAYFYWRDAKYGVKINHFLPVFFCVSKALILHLLNSIIVSNEKLTIQ